MVKQTDIVWSKTKKNVESLITQYIYYNLSIDSGSDFKINKDFTYNMIEERFINCNYIKLTKEEKNLRINYINYVRFSYNKLTSDERKIIYWTYLDKENNYDDSFIANNLGFSLGYYYIKKKEALIRFAYSLGVESTEEVKK